MGVLRFILAMSVIIAHTSPIFGSTYVGGVIAVKAFYIISGFYMSLVLNEKYTGKAGSYKLFITNRFLKIYPMYWIVLLLTISLYGFCYYQNPTDNNNLVNRFITYAGNGSINKIAFLFLILVNLIIIGQDTLLFMGLGTNGYFFFAKNFWNTNPQLYNFLAIPQAWTISLELMFYMLAPFIVKRKLNIIIPLIGLSFILKIIFFKSGFVGDPWNYRFFPFEIGFFLIGNVCYRVYERIKSIFLYFEKLYLPIITGVILITFFYHQIPIHIYIKEYMYYSMIFALIPVLFIASKNKKWDTYTGDLSYLLYISHMFILLVIQKSGYIFTNMLGLTTFILSVLFSVFCKEIIIGKIEKFRQKRVLLSIPAQSKF